jgi:hypothetical protein
MIFQPEHPKKLLPDMGKYKVFLSFMPYMGVRTDVPQSSGV